MKKNFNAIMLAALFLTLSQIAIAAAPANDTWQSAVLISGVSGTKTGTTAEATAQQCEPMHIFPDDDSMPAAKTVWFKWIAPFNGSYTFRVNSTTTTSLSAYVVVPNLCNGNVVSMPVRISENRVYTTPGQLGVEARITFPAAAGTLLYFAADAYTNQDGAEFTLTWDKTKFRYNTQLDYRDGGTDLVITRENSGITEWWFNRTNGLYGYPKHGAMQFGRTTDMKLMGDYNGDGMTDFAAIRPENGQLTWWILSRDGQVLKVVPFGLSTDRPIVGDYDGDGIADIAVTRGEANGLKTWHFLRSSDGSYSNTQFGLATDRATIGDFDADGRTDIVVLRLAGADFTWYILRSADGVVVSRQFGRSGDIPQSADMNRDGTTDMVMYRMNAIGDPPDTAGRWFIINTGGNGQVYSKDWGQLMDRPQIGDYNGDGYVDLTVFRQGIWWLNMSTTGAIAQGFGQAGDRPMSDLGLQSAFLSFQ